MKRDMNIIRSLLLKIEELDSGSGITLPIGMFDGIAEGGVLYGHLCLLNEVSFIEGLDVSSSQYREFQPSRITWEGHEFLNSIRDEGVWRKTVHKLSNVSGEATLEVIQAIAVGFVKEKLGLPA